LVTDTDLIGAVQFTGGITNYKVISANTIEYELLMDQTVGDFTFHEVGLFLDSGELFARGLVSQPSGIFKEAQSLPTVLGNRVIVRAQFTLSNVAALVDFSNITDPTRTEWTDEFHIAAFTNSTECIIDGDFTSEFQPNVAIRASDASLVYSYVVSSSYNGINDETTIIISDPVFTASLVSLDFGIIDPGVTSSLPREIRELIISDDRQLRLENDSPFLQIKETDAAVDEKVWRWRSVGGELLLSSLDDAESVAVEALTVTRAGEFGFGPAVTPVARNHLIGSGESGQVTASWMLENTSSGVLGLDITGTAGVSRARFLLGTTPGTGTNSLTSEFLTFQLEGGSAGNIGIANATPGKRLDMVAANSLGFRIAAPILPEIILKRSNDTTATGNIDFVGSDDVVDWRIAVNDTVAGSFDIQEGGTSRFFMLNGLARFDGFIRTRFSTASDQNHHEFTDDVGSLVAVIGVKGTTGDLFIGSNVTQDFIVLDRSTDRIGILTSSPGFTFDINGTFRAAGLSQIQADANTGGAPLSSQLQIKGESTPEKLLSLAYNTASNYGELSSQSSNGVYTKIVLNPNGGNVGIGSVDAERLLHVRSNIVAIAPHASANLVIEDTGTNYFQFLGNTVDTQGVLFGDTDTTVAGGVVYDHNTDKLTLSANAQLILALSGSDLRAGFRILNPAKNVQIHQPDSSEAFLMFSNSTTTALAGSGIVLGLTSDEKFIMLNQENTDVQLGTNNTIFMTLTAAGDFGLGVDSPNFKVHANGPLFGGVTVAASYQTNNGLVIEYDSTQGAGMITATAVGANNRDIELRALSSGSARNNQFVLSGLTGFIGINEALPDDHLQITAVDGAGLTVEGPTLPIIRLRRSNSTSATGNIDFVGSDNVVDWRLSVDDNIAGAFEIEQGSTSRFIITSIGRVGFGINAPTQNIHLHQGDSGSNFFQFTNTTTGLTSGDGLFVGIDASEQANFLNAENTASLFWTNNTVRWIIAANGGLYSQGLSSAGISTVNATAYYLSGVANATSTVANSLATRDSSGDLTALQFEATDASFSGTVAVIKTKQTTIVNVPASGGEVDGSVTGLTNGVVVGVMLSGSGSFSCHWIYNRLGSTTTDQQTGFIRSNAQVAPSSGLAAPAQDTVNLRVRNDTGGLQSIVVTVMYAEFN